MKKDVPGFPIIGSEGKSFYVYRNIRHKTSCAREKDYLHSDGIWRSTALPASTGWFASRGYARLAIVCYYFRRLFGITTYEVS